MEKHEQATTIGELNDSELARATGGTKQTPVQVIQQIVFEIGVVYGPPSNKLSDLIGKIP